MCVFEKVIKGLRTLGGSGVRGSKTGEKENDVKRTMRYHYFGDFCENRRMVDNAKLKIQNEKLESVGKGGRRTIRRPRSNTAVRRLTPEQRARVDGWLFDEQLSYSTVAARCRSELGVSIPPSCIGAYCRQELANRPRPKASGAAGYLTLLERLNEAALRAAEHIEIDDDPRTLAEFARVLVAARHEANHALRACTMRQKFEFDAATACLIHQVKMQEIAADESLDDTQRILKIREELFGPNLPT